MSAASARVRRVTGESNGCDLRYATGWSRISQRSPKREKKSRTRTNSTVRKIRFSVRLAARDDKVVAMRGQKPCR